MVPPVVLDGSYVSRKASPSNINLVLELSNLPDADQWQGQMLFQGRAELIRSYQIDMLPGLRGLKQDFVCPATMKLAGRRQARWPVG